MVEYNMHRQEGVKNKNTPAVWAGCSSGAETVPQNHDPVLQHCSILSSQGPRRQSAGSKLGRCWAFIPHRCVKTILNPSRLMNLPNMDVLVSRAI